MTGKQAKLRSPNRVKIMTNRAMIYLNGKKGGVVICDVEDVDLIKRFCWSFGSKGYARADNKVMHRMILGEKCPTGRRLVIDHINRNCLDNRKKNLRIVSNSLNIFNTAKCGPNVGVTFQKNCRSKPWKAYIYKNDMYKYLGHFATKEEAILNRQAAELEIYGEKKPR